MHFQKVSEKLLVRSTLRWPYIYFSPLNQDHIGDGCFWKVRENWDQRTPHHRCFDLSQTEGWAVWICVHEYAWEKQGRREGWSVVSLPAVLLSHWPFGVLFLLQGKGPGLGRGAWLFFFNHPQWLQKAVNIAGWYTAFLNCVSCVLWIPHLQMAISR